MKRIIVFGTRGIPDILGGVETHCEKLYPRLVKQGYDITVCRRSCYVSNQLQNYNGVKLKDIYAPKNKWFEAIIHSLLCVCYAKRIKADIVHIHGIGNALIIPFAKFMGLKTVLTHHGFDYERAKWNSFAKKVLRLGEKWGVKCSDSVIVISENIENRINKQFNRSCSLIYNGIDIKDKSSNTEFLYELQIQPKNYILMMGRFVEEKGFHDAINAIRELHYDIRIVLAGDSDHETKYSKNLKELAKKNNVILPGYIVGEKLNQLLTNAKLFILPSYHEGLPFALLEAMSYNIPIVCSDIEANKLIKLPENCYYKVGNIKDLKERIKIKLSGYSVCKDYDLSPYNWDEISKKTSTIYTELE